MIHNAVDILIVGAGPAGLAAGLETAQRGLRTLLLDENPAAGGRIWQALEARGASDPDEAAGLALIRAFNASDAEAHYGAGVWGVEGNTVFWTENGSPRSTEARRIILATGTTERPLPVPGWTLPGVMTIGAAQIALKTAQLVPDGNIWLAGQGPLMWLYAVQAIRAGGRISGILDMADRSLRWRAVRHFPAAIGDLRKGLGWWRDIRAAGVPVHRISELRAEGDRAVAGVSFRTGNKTVSSPADLLLLHDGVVPSIQLTRALGCSHVWDDRQQCWRPETGAWGETSLPGVILAGDGAGVSGASAAVLSGRIAGLGCACALGVIDLESRDRDAVSLRAQHAAMRASRPFIDTLFRPLPVCPHDPVVICRCEEVTAGQIRAAVAAGCQGLNQLKAFTRCGMGPCQGRMCGTSAAQVLAAARGVPVREIEPYRTRFPARPLTVGELAGGA